MRIRRWLERYFIFVCIIAILGWKIPVWYKNHQLEARRDATYKADKLANTELAKANLARLKKVWNADESWEHEISGQGNGTTTYSLEIEHALVTGHPIVVIGTIQDVGTGGNEGANIVTIENHYIANEYRLRFSLVTTPELSNSILAATHNDRMTDMKTFISVATIQTVEKVQPVTDKEGNEETYFLAHGTLLETYETQLPDADPKDLGEN